MACGIKPDPKEARSLNHWTAGEVPGCPLDVDTNITQRGKKWILPHQALLHVQTEVWRNDELSVLPGQGLLEISKARLSFSLLAVWLVGSYFSDQGFNLHPRQQKLKVLTTGQLGNSLHFVLEILSSNTP